MRQGDYQGAIENYEEAIKLDPTYAETPDPSYARAYLNRGLAKARQGDYQGAIQDYDKAIRLDPKLAPAYTNRGLAKVRQGDYKGAIENYEEAIRSLIPTYAEIPDPSYSSGLPQQRPC